MAIIAFEGPDGGGKSTTISAVAKELGIKVIHPGKPPSTFNQYRAFLINQLNAAELHGWHIYDRLSVISEMIYKPLREQVEVTQNGDHREFVRFTLAHLGALICRNTIIVYCRPDDNVIFENSTEFTEHDTAETMETVINKTNDVIDRYDALMMFLKSFGVNVIEYDYEKNDFDTLIRELRRAMHG